MIYYFINCLIYFYFFFIMFRRVVGSKNNFFVNYANALYVPKASISSGFQTSFVPRTVIVRHKLKSTEDSFVPKPRVDWKTEVESLDDSVKEEIKNLRNDNPFEWSLSTLSKKYNISKRAIGIIAKLNSENKEKVNSYNIYKMNPSSNWKGPIHYRRIRTIQKQREEYDKKRETSKIKAKYIENAKANATLV